MKNKKETEGIQSKAKLLYNNSVESTELKALFDYTNNYNLLFDILDEIINSVSNLKVRSHAGSYKNLLLLVPCIAKLIYFEDIKCTSPIYYKIEEAILIIDEELSKKHNRNMNVLLNQLKTGLVEILDILNSYEYIERKKIEEENIEKIRIRRTQAKEITKYILFEVRDIRLIMSIKNDYFHNAIKEDIEVIVKRLCYEYIYGSHSFDEYYYLLFIYLSSDSDFGLNEYINYIMDSFKEAILNGDVKNDDNIEKMKLILKKICLNDSKIKYDIPSPIKDANIDFNINKNDDTLDLRNSKYIFTIDPLDSECLDDAISYEKLPNGNSLIGIYITDLSDIVIPNGEIDRYAYNIAETIYRGKNIPMLPINIYNQYSSLLVGADKLVHAYTFEVTPDYKIVEAKVSKAIIRVSDNYSYGKIDDLIFHSNMPFADDLRDLYDYSQYLLKHNVTRQRYMYSKEVLDPSRKLIDRFGNNPSNRIISELKVLVNSHFALEAYKMDIPFMYRNNLKIQKFENPNFMKLFTDPEFSQIKCALESAYGTSYYSDINEGHSGLNVKAYAHLSTPLRKYSSLFDQRMISNYMIYDDIYNVDSELLKQTCGELAKYLNNRIILNKMYREEVSNKRKILTK